MTCWIFAQPAHPMIQKMLSCNGFTSSAHPWWSRGKDTSLVIQWPQVQGRAIFHGKKMLLRCRCTVWALQPLHWRPWSDLKTEYDQAEQWFNHGVSLALKHFNSPLTSGRPPFIGSRPLRKNPPKNRGGVWGFGGALKQMYGSRIYYYSAAQKFEPAHGTLFGAKCCSDADARCELFSLYIGDPNVIWTCSMNTQHDHAAWPRRAMIQSRCKSGSEAL